MAWQTYVIHVLAIATIFIVLVAGNMAKLGIDNPWLTIVIIPGLVGAIFYAGNQLKPLGGSAPQNALPDVAPKPTP